VPLIRPTIKNPSAGRPVQIVEWAGVTSADTLGVQQNLLPDASAINVQVSGTMGGATVRLHGSETGAGFDTVSLRDPALVPIALTTANQRAEIFERPLWIQPSISGGSGYSITITMVFIQ
jgi:hypothetical protein